MKKLALILVLGLVSCQYTPSEGDIHYSKDSRTGICFASTSMVNYNNYAFTSVECTPAVLELIGQ